MSRSPTSMAIFTPPEACCGGGARTVSAPRRDTNFDDIKIVLLASEVVIMQKKSRSKLARVGGRKDAAPGSKVRVEADAIIERAIKRIHTCQQKLDRKVLPRPVWQAATGRNDLWGGG